MGDPNVVAASQAAVGGYSVTVTSKMMQDYREGNPARDGSSLALAWTAQGTMEVLSVGSDRNLYVLRRDPASLSGWSSERLAFEAIRDLQTYDVDNAYDRVFAVGNLPGQPVFAELVREAGRFVVRSLGMAVAAYHLNVAPCDGDVVCCAVGAKDGGLVGGVLPSQVVFGVRQKQQWMQADRVACLADAANRWPHLPLLMLRDKTLSAHRGTKETIRPRPEEAASGQLPPVDLRYAWLETEAVDIPPLPGVKDFAAVATSASTFLVVAVDGSHVVHALTGTRDASRPGAVLWQAAWTRLDLTDGAARPSFAAIAALTLPGGRLQVLLREGASGNTWITGWGDSGQAVWDRALNLGIAGTRWAVNLNNDSELVFATGSASAGLTTWSRGASLNWHPEAINLPGGTVSMVKTYRTSASVTDEFNASVPQLPVRVSASEHVAAIINGQSYAIGPDQPAAVTTNAMGCVTATLEISNSLHAPTVIMEADFLAGGRLELRPDSAAQTFLKSVTPRQLLDGVDPFSGVPILHGGHHREEDASAVAQALAEVCKMMEEHYEPVAAPAECPVKLRAQRGLRWLPASAERPPFHLGHRAASGGAWSLDLSAGRPLFRRLTHEEFEEWVALARSAAGGAEGLFGIDWGSLWESVKNAITDVVAVAVEAGRAVIKFVINGIERILEYAIAAIEHVFDLVVAVFDAVGTMLGTVVGWLMEAIGFLFNWDEIKQVRDRLRSQIRKMAVELPSRAADPATLAAPFRETLQQMRTRLQEWIAEIDREPVGAGSFQALIGTVPTLPSFFETGGASFFEPVSWLFDKVGEALAKLVGDYGFPPIAGTSEAIASLKARAAEAAEILLSLARELLNKQLLSWIISLQAFEASGIVALLRVLVDKVQRIIDRVDSVVADLVKVLHLAFVNPGSMIDWLDRELHVPFLSAFYKQVLGNELSLFDAACLVLALPLAIFESRGPAISDQGIFLVAWAAFNGLVEIGHVSEWGPIGKLKIFTAILEAIAGLFLTFDKDERWLPLGRLMIMAAVMEVFLRCTALPTPASGLVFLAALLLMVYALHTWQSRMSPQVEVSAVLVLLSHACSLLLPAMPEATRRQPQVTIGYALLQAALGGSVAGLHELTEEPAPA